MANGFKGLLSNPIQAYQSARQPGGFLAPQTTMSGFLGDPRVSIGMAIAQGQPIGQAILGGALQAQTLQETFAKQNLQKKIADGTATQQDYISLYPELAAKSLFDDENSPTTKAVTLVKTGKQVLRSNAEIAANPELYSPAVTGMVTEIGDDGSVRMLPAALYGSQVEKDNTADILLSSTKNLANLGNRAIELLDDTPIGATGGVVRALEGMRDQIKQAGKELGFNSNDYNDEEMIKMKQAVTQKYGSAAGNNARFSGTIITLAYGLARIEEPNNPRFSEGDIIRQMNRLGDSQSAEVFKSGIDEAISQSIDKARVDYEVLKGIDMPDVGYIGLNKIQSGTEEDNLDDPLGLFTNN